MRLNLPKILLLPSFRKQKKKFYLLKKNALVL